MPQMKPNFPQAFEALALVSCQQEKYDQSYHYYETALQLLHSSEPNLSTGSLNLRSRIRFQQSLGIIPRLVSSIHEWNDIRQRYLKNLLSLINELSSNSLSGSNPKNAVGCSSIGYYLIYQGRNISPVLPFSAHDASRMQ
jgi:hypothetical protein